GFSRRSTKADRCRLSHEEAGRARPRKWTSARYQLGDFAGAGDRSSLVPGNPGWERDRPHLAGRRVSQRPFAAKLAALGWADPHLLQPQEYRAPVSARPLAHR